jgi:hypothetical protein
MSRTAIHIRPMRPRTMFEAIPGHRGDDGQHDEIARRGGGVRPGHRHARQPMRPHFDRPRGVVVVEPGHAGEAPLQEELRRQRRDGEVEALDAQARQAEKHADRARHEAGGENPDQNIDAGEEGGQLVAGIRPDPHERRRSQRQQPGVAGEDIEADRGERKDQHRDQHRVEQELIARQGDDHKRDEQDQGEADPVLADRKERHIGGVTRLELANLAIEHSVLPFGRRGVGERRVHQRHPCRCRSHRLISAR